MMPVLHPYFADWDGGERLSQDDRFFFAQF